MKFIKTKTAIAVLMFFPLLACASNASLEEKAGVNATPPATVTCEVRMLAQDSDEIRQKCRQAAEKGDADAQNYVGVMYSQGHGVAQDYAQALKWLRKAEKQGSAKAQNNLGTMYEWGHGVPQNHAEAARLYRLSAEQGVSVAQNNLGNLYSEGRGVAQDHEEAANWYKKAAEQGIERAQYILWKMYYYGEGAEKDYTEAFKWVKKWAEHGSAKAQNNFAVVYMYGQGTRQDRLKALELFSQAAEQGFENAEKNVRSVYHFDKLTPSFSPSDKERPQRIKKEAEQGDAQAEYLLGLMYDIAHGVEHDPAMVMKWLKSAAEKGHAQAQNELAKRYLGNKPRWNESYLESVGIKDRSDAYAQGGKWLRQAANQGLADANYNMGDMYAKGYYGVERNDEEAANWYKKAADQGHGIAQYELGKMYQEGLGVPKNMKEAEKLFISAAQKGSARGAYELGDIYRWRGTPEDGIQRDYEKALRWYRLAEANGERVTRAYDEIPKMEQMLAKKKVFEEAGKTFKEGSVTISTLAGGGNSGFADGAADEAQFDEPGGIAVDTKGNLYVADRKNHRIRKITPKGVVSTLAGDEESGFADGQGSKARFNSPHGIVVDKKGNLYVTDSGNCRIRKITPEGKVSTLAGGGKESSCMKNKDGFGCLTGITIDAKDNLYVTDNSSIYKVTPTGKASVVGNSNLRFKTPSGLAIDKAGNLYMADSFGSTIYKVAPGGEAEYWAGCVTDFLGGGKRGFADGQGCRAQFAAPIDIAIDKAGNVYVTDAENHSIRKISPKGDVITLVGFDEGFVDGERSQARLSYPKGIAIDAAGNLYVTEGGYYRHSHSIRKIEIRQP